MKKISLFIRVALLVAAGFTFPMVAQGQSTYCVRAGATGANNGSDWNNAFSSIPATLQRGATYYIADGNYSGHTFDDAASGSTVITIRKASIAAHGTSTGWNDAYGDGQAVFGSSLYVNTDNWVIDGAVGGGPGSWTSGHGFRINGQFRVNLAWKTTGDRGNNVTLRHCEIDGSSTSGTTPAISAVDVNGLYLSHLYTHATAECFVNTVSVDACVVEYCYVGEFCTDCSPAIHGEIFSWKYRGSLVARWNVFRWVESTGGIMIANTSGDNIEIYGNVFYRTTGESWTYGGDGVVGGWTGRTDLGVWNMKVYNNTFINCNTGGSAVMSALGITPGGNRLVRNNYFYSSPAGLPSGDWNADYDHYQNSGTEQEANGTQGSGDPFVTLDWNSTSFAKLSNDTAAGDTSIPAQYRTDWFGNVGTTRGALQAGSGGGSLSASAGPDTQVTQPNSANLAGSYLNPLGGLVTLSWSKVSGPGTVSFSAPSAATTSATFSTAGTYVLRLTATALLVSVSDETTVTVLSAPDAIAPVVSLLSPGTGASVSNSVTMNATASDNVGVVGVKFFVSGVEVFDDSATPYSYSWDSTWVANGSHQVYAQTRDGAGNTAWSATNTITVNNAAAVLPNPSAYWTFDEGNGATAADGASANVLSLRNGAAWAAGKFGSGLLLDGVDDRADALNSTGLDMKGSTISVAVWVKLESQGTWQQILAKVTDTGAFTSPFFAWHLFGGHASSTQWTPMFQLVNTSEASVNVSSSFNVNYGEWVHLVGVYDGSNVRIYVNGVDRGSAAQSGNVISYNQPLYVGAHGLPDEFAKGVIDEVRVYSGALSPTQVQALYVYNATPSNLPAAPAGLRIVGF